jgi:phage repressor protein C with HTH and peptisase S24 domain
MKIEFAEDLRKKLRGAINESKHYSVASLGRELGDKDYIRDFLIGRKESLDPSAIVRIEQLLRKPAGFFMNENIDEAEDKQSYMARVVGRIGAGAEIQPEFEQLPPEGLYEIRSDFPVTINALAFEVAGESMWPRYDPGDIVICGREGSDLNQIINWEAAVLTRDGRRYLKKVRRGSKVGLFDLESHNAPPIKDVKIEWAAEVIQVIRAGRWKKMPQSHRQRAIARSARG